MSLLFPSVLSLQTLAVRAALHLLPPLPTAASCSSYFLRAIFKAPPFYFPLSPLAAESILERREEIASVTANNDAQYDNLSRCCGEWATGRGNNQRRPAVRLFFFFFFFEVSFIQVLSLPPSHRALLSPLLIDPLTLTHYNEGALNQCFNEEVL